MVIYDNDKRTFTNPNELHNEEAVESIFGGTGLTALDINHYPQASLKNQIGSFDEAYI